LLAVLIPLPAQLSFFKLALFWAEERAMPNSPNAMTADTFGPERRSWTRQAVVDSMLIPVEIGVDKTFGLLVDLSEGGAAVQSLAALEVGGRHRLRWNFPDDDASIEAVGEIVWSRENLNGISFLDVAESCGACIRHWLAKFQKHLDTVEATRDHKSELTADDTPGATTSRLYLKDYEPSAHPHESDRDMLAQRPVLNQEEMETERELMSREAICREFRQLTEEENRDTEQPPPLFYTEPDTPSRRFSWGEFVLVIGIAVMAVIIFILRSSPRGVYDPSATSLSSDQAAPILPSTAVATPGPPAPDAGNLDNAAPPASGAASQRAADSTPSVTKVYQQSPVPAPVAKQGTRKSSYVSASGAPSIETSTEILTAPTGIPALAPGGGVSAGPELISQIPPAYSALTISGHQSGSVELMVAISREGQVTQVNVVSGDPVLARAAKEAVLHWRYRPAMVDGHPVPVHIRVSLNLDAP
jgi:TonB family protein